MTESLDIDPLLREYLEQRRGLTDDEIDRLLIEWNNQGSLTDFLAGKALLDRTTAKMLITAQKGYLSSSPDELRTVLGVRLKLRLNTNHNAQTAAPHATATETVTEPVIPKTPERGESPARLDSAHRATTGNCCGTAPQRDGPQGNPASFGSSANSTTTGRASASQEEHGTSRIPRCLR